jgi:hypothetical protein
MLLLKELRKFILFNKALCFIHIFIYGKLDNKMTIRENFLIIHKITT